MALWFATKNGLAKFDGTNFTVYRQKPGNAASLQANEILALHEDKKGNLWIGTSGGSLSLYDRKRDAFINFPTAGEPYAINSSIITGICSDYLGKIWVTHYSGVNILDPATKKVSKLPIPSGNSNSFFTKSSICLFEDSQHKMWIGTNEGLFIYNPKTKSLTQFVHSSKDPTSLSSNQINVITEDKKGNIWVGTYNG